MPKQSNLDKEVIEFLKKQDWPVTTEGVAKAVNCTWHTAQIHLFKLVSERKVKHKKVGRQNQFWLTEKYKKEFKEKG